MSFRQAFALALVGVVSHSTAAGAVGAAPLLPPLSAEQMEAARALLAVSAFVQAVVIESPSGQGTVGTCTVEMRVVRSLAKPELLPERQRFRVQLPCADDPTVAVATLPGGGDTNINRHVPNSMLTSGNMLELHVARMNFGPVDAYLPIGTPLPILAETVEPQGNPNNPGPHWDRFAPLQSAGSPKQMVPARFPARDVTLEYRLDSRPSERLRAAYDSKRWRVLVERVGADPAEGAVRLDWLTRTAIRMWPHRSDFQMIPISRKERFGMLTLDPNADIRAEGSDTVAGFQCTNYSIRSRHYPAAVACVTDDGLPLRRTDETGTMEVTRIYESGYPSPDPFSESERLRRSSSDQ